MKHILSLLLLAASAFAQTATITDTISTPFGGTFNGTVTVSLNSPALAQPLYSGNVTLSGWTQTVTVTSGAFSLTLYTNDQITPTGTSYSATFAPASGSGWKETWVVPSGATTIREIRSTTVPSPSVKFNLSQLNQNGATLGQGLRWNGSAWAPGTFVADPMTATGDLITRSGGVAVRVPIGTTGQILTVTGGLPAWATNFAGNAATATALAADPANCSAGTLPRGVDASGAGQGCAAVSLTADVSGTLPNANTTATSANSASAIVARDASGNFSAGTVTAALSGNASTATTLATARTIAGVSFNGSADIAIPSTGLSDSANLVRNNAANTYTAGTKQTFASNATTAGAAFGGGITADPSSVAAGDFWYRADLGTFGYRNASAVDALVAGGRALTTPGAVPFVTSAGVLGQDAVFNYNAASDILTVGQNAASPLIRLIGPGGAFQGFVDLTPSKAYRFTTAASGNLFFGVFNGSSWNDNFVMHNATANVTIGTQTDANFRLNVGSSGSSGTAQFYDATATTGVTQVVVRAGAGQSTTALMEWRNAAGSSRLFVYDNGNLLSTGKVFFNNGAADNSSIGTTGLALGSNIPAAWSSTTSESGTKDLSLSRASAGVLQVGDGGSNANGTVNAAALALGAGSVSVANGFGLIGSANSLGLIYTAGQIEFRSTSANRLMTLGGTGVVTVRNETPTTGVTQMIIQAGAGQSTTGLQEWRNAAGSAMSFITSTGFANFPGLFLGGGSGTLDANYYRTGFTVATGYQYFFSSTASANGTPDVAFNRNRAGVIETNSGTAIGTTPGNARDVMARQHFMVETSSNPSAADLSIAGGNAQDVASVYVKNDKLVVAYNRSGTVNYLTIPLDGATTTFTQSTTAP